MQWTLGTLVRAIPALRKLAGLPLALRPAYDVARLLRLAEPEIAHWESVRASLVTEYGDERPPTEAEAAAGQTAALREVRPADLDAFLAAMAALDAIPITIAAVPVPFAVLPAASTWSALELVALGPLLEAPVDVVALEAPAPLRLVPAE